MTNLTRSAAGVLLCLAGARFLPGPIGGTKSLDSLLAASDTIVVGDIVQGTVSGTAVSLSIQIDRVLKGPSAAGTVATAVGAVSAPTPTRSIAHIKGIFFLANGAAGPMRFVPVTNGFVLDELFLFVPLPDASVAAQTAAGASARERVLLEVLGGIEIGPLNQPGGYIAPEAEYRMAPAPAVQSVFRRWLISGPPRLVTIALQALLAEGDLAALSRVATDPALRASAVEAGAFNGLKWYCRNADPGAVKLLGQLASDNSNSMELRIAAASALARVHTKQALPYLASFLDSSDATLRTCGVGGLAMFANNVPIGLHEPAAGAWPWRTEETIAHSAMDQGVIARNPAYYVGFWKSWWTANQIALSQ